MSKAKRQVKIGFSIWPTGRHASAWRLPEANIHGTVEREFLEQTIRTSERGKFDYYFIGSVNHSNPWLQNSRHNDLFKIEPFTLAAYAAAITTHIGLVVTINSTYSDPYNVARATASLDHLSKGRAALNIVTGAAGSFAAANFSKERHLGTDERYDLAEELIDSVKDLWDSWEDDWLVGDKEKGLFLDVNKAHAIKRKGKYFSIEGPLNVPRPPQGHLPILHAGTSERSNEYGAKYADIRFIAYSEKAHNKKYYGDIKGRLAKFGRRKEDQYLVPGITFFVGETSSEAHAKFRQVQDLSVNQYVPQQISAQLGTDLSRFLPTDRVKDVIDVEKVPQNAWLIRSAIDGFGDASITLRDLFHFLGNVPHGQPPVVGSGKEVADWIEEQFEERALDGVKLFPPYLPAPLDAFVDYVIPELQHKGIFRREYETSTFRGHLGLENPDNVFANSRIGEAAE